MSTPDEEEREAQEPQPEDQVGEERIDLSARFPEMRPIAKPPSLYTLNGIGTAMYGRRAFDPETGTYIKTRCFCFIFFPLLALRAFRVADAPQGGWYFLGRESLSAFAKAWNFAVLAMVLVVAGALAWSSYTGSPDHLAGLRLQEAEVQLQSGDVQGAARTYLEVIRGGTRRAGSAREALEMLVEERFSGLSLEDAAAVAESAALARARLGESAGLKIFERGLALVEKGGKENPRTALKLLDAISPLAPEGKDLSAARERLIRSSLAKEPADAELASQLALILEKRGELDACESLLEPVRGKLGSTEGARILGQIYARKDRIEEAHAILTAYTEDRLKRLHAAEKDLDDTANRIWDGVLEELRKGKANGFDYQAYKNADDERQEAMVNSYIQGRVARSPAFQERQEALKMEAGVVPVAMDLGIVRLRRAQSLGDPEARKKELEAAERTFLSIRGFAGESNEYRLFLGQVSYWLGKSAEGQKLFEELLKSNERSGDMLLAVSRTLREVGEETEARRLAEEAFSKEKDEDKQCAAARMRSLMPLDLDDQIKWLRRAGTSNPDTVASLNTALGEKARSEGKDEEAIGYLRKAIETYAGLPKNSANLNNCALANFSLFNVTGDRSDFKKSVELLEEALALEPGDSILLYNVAHSLLQSVVLDIASESVDLRPLKAQGDLDLLSSFYVDEAGRQDLVRRFRSHKDLARAIACCEKLLVLSPRSGRALSMLFGIHRFTRDAAALREIEKRLQVEKPDLSGDIQQGKDFYAGKRDDELRKAQAAGIARYEKLLASIPKDREPLLFAIAACSWADSWFTAHIVGVSPDADKLVAVAEEAHALKPSAETRSTVTAALLFRLSQRVAKKDAAFAAYLERSRRSLGASYCAAAAIGRFPSVREAFTQDADGRRALELIRERVRAFPGMPAAWNWAILQAVDPAAAEEIVRASRDAEVERISRNISLELSPLNASSALEASWAKRMEGQEAEAQRILTEAARRGIPLPFDPDGPRSK